MPEKNPEFNSDLEIEIIQLPEDEYDFILEDEDINYNNLDVPPAPGKDHNNIDNLKLKNDTTFKRNIN